MCVEVMKILCTSAFAAILISMAVDASPSCSSFKLQHCEKGPYDNLDVNVNSYRTTQRGIFYYKLDGIMPEIHKTIGGMTAEVYLLQNLKLTDVPGGEPYAANIAVRITRRKLKHRNFMSPSLYIRHTDGDVIRPQI